MNSSEPKVAERVVVEEVTQAAQAPPRILLTNDDGVDSAGIRTLAAALSARYDIVVAAPSTDMSGSGTGIGRFDPGVGVDLSPVDMGGVEAYAVAGPPGLAVMAGALGAFGKVPDLVVSGINAGINTGHSVIHSGTVGGALTARTFGSHGVAVSLVPSKPWQWETAIEVSMSAVAWILLSSGPKIVLNINVPAVPFSDLKGVRWARLDEFGYFRVAVADAEGGKIQFEVAGAGAGSDELSDTSLCGRDYATVTPLSALNASEFPTDGEGLIWSREPADVN